MQSFYYRSGRNAATALISGSLAALTGWQWWSDGDILWMTTTLVFGLAALKGALNSVNSEPALKFDRDRLWVRTTFGSRVMTWQQVYGIALQVMTVRYWGIVHSASGISVHRLRRRSDRGEAPAYSGEHHELPIGGARALVQILRDAQLTAVGQTGVAMAGAGQTVGGFPERRATATDA